ncbi:MAG: hypothetical protein QM765_16780 [Myxococcales bacterium]
MSQDLEVEILGHLAPGIAHDFNNLLAAISADADMARRVTSPGHPAHEFLEAILKTVAQGMGLTAHVLANARPRPLQLREVQLAEEVRFIAGLLRRVAGAAVTIELDLAEGLPNASADPAQLCQALFRLAGTAHGVTSKCRLVVGLRAVDDGLCLSSTLWADALPPNLFETNGLSRQALERIASDHDAHLTLVQQPDHAALTFVLPALR